MSAGFDVHVCRADVRSAVCWWDSSPATAWTESIMLAAAEVASQGPPGFQVGDAIALLGRVDHSDRRSPPGSPFDGDRADQAPRAEARPAHRVPGQDGQHSACPLHCFSATNARGPDVALHRGPWRDSPLIAARKPIGLQ